MKVFCVGLFNRALILVIHLTHALDGDIRIQHRNGAVVILGLRLRNLDIQLIGINFHVIGNDLDDIRFQHFQYLRGAVHPVMHQNQL